MIEKTKPDFIASKINECGQAVVYRYIDNNKKQVLSLETDLKMDNPGQIRINLNGAFGKIHADDQFPVYMFFYKKGLPFCLTGHGLAVQSNNEPYNNFAGSESEDLWINIYMNSVKFMPLGKRNSL